MKLLWRRRAELELKSQLDYLRNVSPQGERRMRERIKQRLARLKRFPRTGRPSEDGLYELVIAGTPYLAVYEVDADTITILGFFHGKENRGPT